MARIPQLEKKDLPAFFQMLSSEDQKMYKELQSKVGNEENRYNRFRRLLTMNESFDSIREYCEYETENRWKRYLVCGVCWFEDYMAINTKQLRILLVKCKSSINGALAKMGYVTIPKKSNDSSFLTELIPFLKTNTSELRQWTVRKRIGCIGKEGKYIDRIVENTVANFNDNFDFNIDLNFDDMSSQFDNLDFIENEANRPLTDEEIMQLYEHSFPTSFIFTIIVEEFPFISSHDIEQSINRIKNNRERDELLSKLN